MMQYNKEEIPNVRAKEARKNKYQGEDIGDI